MSEVRGGTSDSTQQQGCPDLSEGQIDANTLQKIITEYRRDYGRKRRINQWMGFVLGLGGILLSLLATIYGIQEQPQQSAIAAACAAATQALLFAYPVDKRAGLYRLLKVESSSLEEEIAITPQPTQKQLSEIFESFKLTKLKSVDEDGDSNLSEIIDEYYQQIRKEDAL